MKGRTITMDSEVIWETLIVSAPPSGNRTRARPPGEKRDLPRNRHP